jgi:hypothetical protein
LVLAAIALLLVSGCAPSGPSYQELATTDVFATSMPDAVELGAGGGGPEWTIEGAHTGFAWRLLVTDLDEASVIAWHTTALESDGWTPTDFGDIAMSDGHLTDHAWRRDDLVLGLGFPDRDRIQADHPAGTLYEVTIAHRPEDG